MTEVNRFFIQKNKSLVELYMESEMSKTILLVIKYASLMDFIL